jgi:hypothetical protein
MRTADGLRSFFANPPQEDSPLPHELMMAVRDGFRVASEAGRRNIVTKLGPQARRVCWSFAANMAVLAVRRNAPELVEVGLCALAVEAVRGDIRDSIVTLAELNHSAMKLGMNT